MKRLMLSAKSLRRGGSVNLITEEILDQAIAAAKLGHINGLTYDQTNWCGTACCVLGFARHIAGLPEQDEGPSDLEFAESPRIDTIRELMTCPSPDILRVMESVDGDGIARLVGANLVGARLVGASLDGANLDGANLYRANLVGANLVIASLVRARLDGASLVIARLVGASLDGASLVGANLDGASLVGASLDGANLYGARLVGASLYGASLDGATRWDTETASRVPVTREWLIQRGAIL